jgi:hypothetical protein
MKVDSAAMHMGIYEIVDLKFTSDSHWLFIAYSSGVINVHNMGDKSMNFVCQVQPEYQNACF